MDALPSTIQPLRINASDLTYGYVWSAAQVLVKADKAYRENRQLSRVMKHDPDLASAMKIREYAVAGLPWSILPEDEGDPAQAAECAAITETIMRMRGKLQFFGHLARAFWPGSAAAAMQYAQYANPVAGKSLSNPHDPDSDPVFAECKFGPTGYIPLHGDALAWTIHGDLVIRTNGWTNNFGGAEKVSTVDGWAAKLTPAQRATVVVNTFNRDAPDFDDAMSAERVWGGFGLRSLLWYGWMNKQHLEQAASHYAERLGRGTTLAYYGGGAQGQLQAQKLLDAMFGTYAATVPYPSPDHAGMDPVKIIEPAGTGYQIFREMIDLISSKLRKAILHQDLTSGTASTGLGSGVAEAHERTFATVIRHDAMNLADALSEDLVRPMVEMNFPGRRARYRFEFSLEQDNTNESTPIDRAKALYEMGVSLAEREMREIGGFREPTPGEPVVMRDGGEVTDLAQEVARAGRETPED